MILLKLNEKLLVFKMMSKRIKLAATGVTVIAFGCVVYDGYRCVQRLRKPLNTNFLNRRSEYIFINHDYFREPVKDFLNELFQEETLIYSILYNLKKKLTFTKVRSSICNNLLRHFHCAPFFSWSMP